MKSPVRLVPSRAFCQQYRADRATGELRASYGRTTGELRANRDGGNTIRLKALGLKKQRGVDSYLPVERECRDS